jgi:hypothetical protein
VILVDHGTRNRQYRSVIAKPYDSLLVMRVFIDGGDVSKVGMMDYSRRPRLFMEYQ